MKNDLEDLLDAGEHLIGQIEDARDSVQTRLSEIGGAANDIDESLHMLSREADLLHRQIAAARPAQKSSSVDQHDLTLGTVD